MLAASQAWGRGLQRSACRSRRPAEDRADRRRWRVRRLLPHLAGRLPLRLLHYARVHRGALLLLRVAALRRDHPPVFC